MKKTILIFVTFFFYVGGEAAKAIRIEKTLFPLHRDDGVLGGRTLTKR